jgi:Tfp pilus assembly protein PilO
MSRNRLMLLLAVVAAVVVAAGGFFLGVQPQLDRAATAKSDTESISAGNATTRAEIARLRQQAKSLPEMRTRLATLQASVPDAAGVSSFISQLNGTADTAGVQVATITVGDATAYSPPAAPAGGDTSSDTASSDASATATATPAPTAVATTPAAPETATDSSITSRNFSVIPVSVTVNGEFPGALTFVKGVQSNSRLFLIDSISSSSPSTAAADDSDAQAESPSWTFSGSIYVLSDAAAAASAKG